MKTAEEIRKCNHLILANPLTADPSKVSSCPVTVYQKLGAFFRVSIDDLLKSYPNPNLT